MKTRFNSKRQHLRYTAKQEEKRKEDEFKNFKFNLDYIVKQLNARKIK